MNGDPVVTMTRSELRQLVSEAVSEAIGAHDPPTPPTLLDRHEIARALGVSARTVARLRGEGMPVVWVLESPRFELPEVLEWLRGNSERLARTTAGVLDSAGSEPKSAVHAAIPARGPRNG